MSTTNLNEIKCDLAVAYVRAVCAKCDYSVEETGRSFDGLGIDCIVRNYRNKTDDGSYNPASEITIQIKGTSLSSQSMCRETSSHFEYNATGVRPAHYQHYLVVLKLPEDNEISDWLTITEDSMILKKCAYYIRINENVSGFLKIPKSNIFNQDSLPKMFSITKEEFMEKIK